MIPLTCVRSIINMNLHVFNIDIYVPKVDVCKASGLTLPLMIMIEFLLPESYLRQQCDREEKGVVLS